MDRRATGSTGWAAGVIAPTFGGDVEAVSAIAYDVKQAAARQMMEQAHALICESMPALAIGWLSSCLIHQTRR